MKLFCRIYLTIPFVIFSLNSFSKNEDGHPFLDTLFKDDIKSVQLFREDASLSHPLINLGEDDHLVLKFDELTDEVGDYYYTIIHCDFNWNESNLLPNEYLNGFTDNSLDDYAVSFNTTMSYVNYQLKIPNDQVQLKYSGNYVIVVYEGTDREKVVLTRRFQVLDQKTEVTGTVKKATFDPYHGENQEIDFLVQDANLQLSSPAEEVKVVVMKNRCWENAITTLKPLYIRQNVLDYDYNRENVFPGGNEYRYFDLRTFRSNGMNVRQTVFSQPYYHITLTPDKIRAGQKYFRYKEMNGNYLIESQDKIVKDYDTECDYGFVHFTLDMDSPLKGGTVHVFGELTGKMADKKNEMIWNADRSAYELTLLLKQGYYNYEYVYLPGNSNTIDESNLEGSHYETGNEYEILVYYKQLSGRYDELVGYLVLTGND